MDNLAKLSDSELMTYFKMFVKMRSQSYRNENVKVQGADFKFLYHVVRLIDECEQILTEGDLDLQRNREQLKAIRRGEWTEKQVGDYFTLKEKSLEEVYNKSTLRWGPDEDAIKELLLNCLEEHYGNLDKCVVKQDAVVNALRKVIAATDEGRKVLGLIEGLEIGQDGG